jgi:hypothetical protein
VTSVGRCFVAEDDELLRRSRRDRVRGRPPPNISISCAVRNARVEYVGWFNHDRPHESLDDIPPVEFEQPHATIVSIQGNGIGSRRSRRGRRPAYNAPNHSDERGSRPKQRLAPSGS